jgi:hypothetical protein
VALNLWFAAAWLEQHPARSFIGHVEAGVYWLGYHYNAHGLAAFANTTLEHFKHNLHRLRLGAPTFGMSTPADYVSQLIKHSS